MTNNEKNEARTLQIPSNYSPFKTLEDFKKELLCQEKSLEFKKDELLKFKDKTNLALIVFGGVMFSTYFIDLEKSAFIILSFLGCLGVLHTKTEYIREKSQIENSINRNEEYIKELKEEIRIKKRELKKKAENKNE